MLLSLIEKHKCSAFFMNQNRSICYFFEYFIKDACNKLTRNRLFSYKMHCETLSFSLLQVVNCSIPRYCCRNNDRMLSSLLFFLLSSVSIMFFVDINLESAVYVYKKGVKNKNNAYTYTFYNICFFSFSSIFTIYIYTFDFKIYYE